MSLHGNARSWLLIHCIVYLMMFVVPPIAATYASPDTYNQVSEYDHLQSVHRYHYSIALQCQDEVTRLQRENQALKEQVTAGDRSRMQLRNHLLALENQIAHERSLHDAERIQSDGRIQSANQEIQRLLEGKVRNVDAANYFATPSGSPDPPPLLESKLQSPRRQSIPMGRMGRCNAIHHPKPHLAGRLKGDLFKTKMCNGVLSGRGCLYGTNCAFAHSTDELRTEQEI